MTAPARRATQIFDRGRQSAYAAPGALELRRELDPNEGARWAIVVAAMLLFAYSVVSGPVNFAVARNRGRPLSALVAHERDAAAERRRPVFARDDRLPRQRRDAREV